VGFLKGSPVGNVRVRAPGRGETRIGAEYAGSTPEPNKGAQAKRHGADSQGNSCVLSVIGALE